MIVLKFGGALLDGPEGAMGVIRQIDRIDADALIVVSAFGGMTNRFERLAEIACTDPSLALEMLEEIVADHRRVAEAIIPSGRHADWETATAPFTDRLRGLIEGLSITGELSPRTLDLVVHFGERFSSATIAPVLGARLVPAPDLLITDDRHRFAAVRLEESRRRVESELRPLFGERGGDPIRVVTEGYIARGAGGEITTMGRETSDYSAALFGALLGADEVRIYTAVPGVMTADPKLFAGARTIEGMSYAMAREIALLGAKIIHPRTVRPVEEAGIPLVLTDLQGNATLIDREPGRDAASFPLLINVGLIRCELKGTTGVDDEILDFVRRHRPAIRVLRVGRRLSILTDEFIPGIAEEITHQFPHLVDEATVEHFHLMSFVRERGVAPEDAARFLESLRDEGVATFWGDPDERSVSALIGGNTPRDVLERLHRQFLPD